MIPAQSLLTTQAKTPLNVFVTSADDMITGIRGSTDSTDWPITYLFLTQRQEWAWF